MDHGLVVAQAEDAAVVAHQPGRRRWAAAALGTSGGR